MEKTTYKLKYAFFCSIVFPAIIYTIFHTTSSEWGAKEYLASIFLGLFVGFIIGLMKDRWTIVNKKLLQLVDFRTEELRTKMRELDSSQKRVQLLKGLLPVCSCCKDIKDTRGDWNTIEQYIQTHPGNGLALNLCPDCTEKVSPGITKHGLKTN